MAAKSLKTFEDIYTAVAEELKLNTSDTSTLDRIKRDINMGYREIASRENWMWLKKFIALTHYKFISTGTISVTINSNSVTFSSAPSLSVAGYWLKIGGNEEMYQIQSHTAGATAAVLSSRYTQATAAAATYRCWTDKIPLPTNCAETVSVSHQWLKNPMEGVGISEYKEFVARRPDSEGYPRLYSTGDYKDPNPYDGANVGTSATRSSSGLVKTIVFGASVAASVEVGDLIQVSSAGSASYNGEFVVRSVATTTITYTGLVPLQESSTVDVGINVKLKSQRTSDETYRELMLYPSQFQDHDITLHVDYVQLVKDLEDTTDEPLIPVNDRSVLLYFALHRSWVKQRNEEVAIRNERMYETKLQRMSAKAQDSEDKPNIMPSMRWAEIKRRASRNWGRRRF